MSSIHQMGRMGESILGRENGVRKGLAARKGGPCVSRNNVTFRVAGGYCVSSRGEGRSEVV